MFSAKTQKKIINSFLSQLFKKVFFWVLLGIGLAILGGFLGSREFISKDILGSAYYKLTGKTVEFNRFFLGINLAERKKLLSFALIFLMIIVVANTLATLINIVYRIRDKYIEDNEFYLYNAWIYLLYTLSKIISYIIITLCLCSFQTLLLAVAFISIYSWFWSKKGPNHPQTKNMFLWNDPNVWKILLYSSLIIFILPFFYNKFQKILSAIKQQEMQGGNVSELQKAIKNLFAAIPGLQIIIDLLANISSFAHLIILLLFARAVVFGSIREFDNFWNDIKRIGSRYNAFKFFYYYQKTLGKSKKIKFDSKNKADIPAKTKKLIILGDYGFFNAIPDFFKFKNDLRREEDLEKFTKNIKETIEIVNFIQSELNPGEANNYYQKEVNFITFKIFNDKNQNLVKARETKKLIQLIRMKNPK